MSYIKKGQVWRHKECTITAKILAVYINDNADVLVTLPGQPLFTAIICAKELTSNFKLEFDPRNTPTQ